MRALLPLLLLLAACGEQIVVENQTAQLTLVGFELSAAQLVDVNYTLSDYEGDEQELRVQVCESPGLTRCGAPFQGAGSDGAAFVNTAPQNMVVQHRFRWDIGCGRLGAEGVLASTIEQPYVLRIGVEGGELIDSDPFTLSSLGVTALPPCGRP